jgi:hypothetical protein
MAKNLLHCETGFGVYRSTQLGHIPFFLLLYLLVGPSIVRHYKNEFTIAFLNVATSSVTNTKKKIHFFNYNSFSYYILVHCVKQYTFDSVSGVFFLISPHCRR